MTSNDDDDYLTNSYTGDDRAFIRDIYAANTRQILKLIKERPDFLTDKYYSDFGLAIGNRIAELLAVPL